MQGSNWDRRTDGWTDGLTASMSFSRLFCTSSSQKATSEHKTDLFKFQESSEIQESQCKRLCSATRHNNWHLYIHQVTWLASQRSEVQAHVCFMPQLFFIIETGIGIVHFLCAMRVFDVRASSSSPRLPLCQIVFVSFAASIAELAHGEKLHTQSFTWLIWCTLELHQ